jgi:hypothetical protein
MPWLLDCAVHDDRNFRLVDVRTTVGHLERRACADITRFGKSFEGKDCADYYLATKGLSTSKS